MDTAPLDEGRNDNRPPPKAQLGLRRQPMYLNVDGAPHVPVADVDEVVDTRVCL